jgi:hypothetical protein
MLRATLPKLLGAPIILSARSTGEYAHRTSSPATLTVALATPRASSNRTLPRVFGRCFSQFSQFAWATDVPEVGLMGAGCSRCLTDVRAPEIWIGPSAAARGHPELEPCGEGVDVEIASQTPSRSSSAETLVLDELSRDRTPPRRKCSGGGRPHQAAGGTDEAAETYGAVSTRVPVAPLWGYRGLSLPVFVSPVPAHGGTDEAADQGGAVSTRVPVPPSAISRRRKKLEKEVGALTAATGKASAELAKAKKSRDDLAELKKAGAAAKNCAGTLEAKIRQLEKDLAEAGKTSEALAASAAGVQAGEHDHFSVPPPPPLEPDRRAVVASQTARLVSTPPASAADQALENAVRVGTLGSSKASALWERRYGRLEHRRSAPPPSFLRVPCADREHCA